ncbi:MAG: hypothetical protein ABWZ40_08930 [Caulobacterales bacterium]
MRQEPKKPAKIQREMPKVEGEGSYTATRAYNERLEGFIKDKGDRIDEMAKDAAAELDSPKGNDLKKAEKEGRSHAKH